MADNTRGPQESDDGIASRTTGDALAGWDGVQDPAEPVSARQQANGSVVLQSEMNGLAWIASDESRPVEDMR